MINCVFADFETQKKILKRYPRGQDILPFLDAENEKARNSVWSELVSLVEPLKIVAARDQLARAKKFSIREFIRRGEGILVIQLNTELLEVERPMIQALIYTLFDAINSSPRSDRKDNIVWADDFSFLGKVPRLEKFAEFSRGKGGVLYAIAQTVESFYDIYGKDAAEAILGNFAFRAMHCTDSSTTARFNAAQFGKKEFREEVWSTSIGVEGASPSVRIDRYVQDVVFDSAFLELPFASERVGVNCYLASPYFGFELEKNIPWSVLKPTLPPKRGISLTPIPAQLQYPKHWTDARKQLCVEGRVVKPNQQLGLIHPGLSMFEEEIRAGIFAMAEEVIQEVVLAEYERLKQRDRR